MSKEGSLLYLRNQYQKIDAALRQAERALHDADLPTRVRAAGDLIHLRRRRNTIVRKITRVQADGDGPWSSLKDEFLVDLDAISATLDHYVHRH